MALKGLRLCLIGFGNVGYGLLQVLWENQSWLSEHHGFAPRIVAIHDIKRGTALDPQGLPIPELLAAWEHGERVDSLSAEPTDGLDAFAVMEESGADVVLELTPTDLGTGEPGTSHIRAALRLKKHVVTTNKGPLALHCRELRDLARENRVQLRFEGTVMAGTPLFSLWERGFAAPIRRIRGILNGTTNFILTEMEQGKTYAEALAQAQRLGYAETDPRADVEGLDALAKVAILAQVVLEGDLRPADIPAQGITAISPEDIKSAAKEGKRWKLLAVAERNGDEVRARVGPEKLPLTDPLSQVSGVLNALTFELDPLGAVTIIGPGAGRKVTGHAVLSDLLAIHHDGD